MACAFALASCSSTSVSNRTLVKVPTCIKRCTHTAASEGTEGNIHPLIILGVGEGELVLSFTGSSRCHVCAVLRHWEDWFPGCTCSVHGLWKQKLPLNCSHQAGLCITVVYAPASSCTAAEMQPQVMFHEEMSGVCPVVSFSWGKLSTWARHGQAAVCGGTLASGRRGQEELMERRSFSLGKLLFAALFLSSKCLRGWW